jgi:glycosyltransferase involved in cell wall biosynthesis
MPKISIIIPVYNSEKYLRECLDSCVNQTLRDIEIICVNDASPDNSASILTEYAQQDKRVKILTHNSNKGQGAARNTGLKTAEGEYIWFVDSDDFIVLQSGEILYALAKQYDADIVRFNAVSFIENQNNERIYENSKTYFCNWRYDSVISIDKEKHTLSGAGSTVWNFFTKKHVYQNISFREGVFHEDTDFTPIVFSSVKTVYCVPYAFYFRRKHQESTTGGGVKKEKLLLHYIESCDSMFDFIQKNKLSKKHFCVNNLLNSMEKLFDRYSKNSAVHNAKYDGIFRKIFKKFSKTDICIFSIKRRIKRKINIFLTFLIERFFT